MNLASIPDNNTNYPIDMKESHRIYESDDIDDKNKNQNNNDEIVNNQSLKIL